MTFEGIRVKLRRHLTYANVTATLALDSPSRAALPMPSTRSTRTTSPNGSLRSVDLKNHKAVRGIDVKRNSLTGREINEGTLQGPGAARPEW